jgi:hypothetical protein
MQSGHFKSREREAAISPYVTPDESDVQTFGLSLRTVAKTTVR